MLKGGVKGTVLFSWCGSGLIMPQKDLERKRELKEGFCCGVWAGSTKRELTGDFSIELCTYNVQGLGIQKNTLNSDFQSED